MKAARWHGAKDIRVETIDEPKPEAGQVKIKVAWTGICGSDLHEYLAGPIFVPVAEDHPLSHDKAPIVMGHEYCGTVVEVGDGVSGLAVGDRVAIEPAAVALHAVRVSALKAGDKAAVFGAGPIGLLVVESLRIAGASEIYVVEPSETRRQKALALGATAAFDPSADDPVEAIRDRTLSGVDVAFEVTGVPAVLPQTIESTRYEGQTIIVSIWETQAGFQPNTVVLRERDIKGTIAYRNVYPAVMALMERGYYSTEKLVTKRIALDDIVRDGFEALAAEKSQIKILVEAPS